MAKGKTPNHADKLILQLLHYDYLSRSNTKTKKLHDLVTYCYLGAAFAAPVVFSLADITIVGFVVTFVMLVGFLIFINVHQKLTVKRFLQAAEADFQPENIVIIPTEKPVDFQRLYNSSACTFFSEPSDDLMKFLYLWLIRGKYINGGELIVYTFDSHKLKDAFDVPDVDISFPLLCISLRDLNISDDRLPDFSREAKFIGAEWLDEIVDQLRKAAV